MIRHATASIVIVTLLASTTLTAFALHRTSSGPTDFESGVNGFLKHYLTTLESRDERAIRDLFVTDDRFSWYTDGARSYSTADDVLRGMRQFANVRFKTTLSKVRVVELSPSLASVRSTFRTHLTIPGRDDHEYGGVITWLLERDPAKNAWRVLLGHTSTPGGPPSKEQHRLERPGGPAKAREKRDGRAE